MSAESAITESSPPFAESPSPHQSPLSSRYSRSAMSFTQKEVDVNPTVAELCTNSPRMALFSRMASNVQSTAFKEVFIRCVEWYMVVYTGICWCIV